MHDTATPPLDGPAPVLASATHIAEMSLRALAVLLDTFVIAAVFAVVATRIAASAGGISASGFDLHGTPAAVAAALTAAIAFAYYWLLEGWNGATLGKAMIVGLRVRSPGGGTVGLQTSLVRNVARVLDGIGDHHAHTVVLDKGRDGVTPVAAVVATLFVLLGVGVAVHMERRAASGVTGIAVHAGKSAPSTAVTTSRSPDANDNASASGATITAATGALTLSRLRWLDRPDGSPREPLYRPLEDVVATFEITGYGTDAHGTAHVTIRLVATDPSGVEIHKPFSLDVRAEHPGKQPITGSYHVGLPAFVLSGTYVLHIRAHDASSGTDTEFDPTFTVRGDVTAPSNTLVVRDFRFSTTEDGEPVQPPVFHPGQKIYFAFQIAGVQLREDHPDVHIGIALLAPDGHRLLGSDNWGQVTLALAYHPPTFFLPIDSYVSLPGDVQPGTYVQRVTVRDGVAGANTTLDSKFEVVNH